MAKPPVYVPDELWERASTFKDRLDFSALFQQALIEALQEVKHSDQLDRLVRDYQQDHGKFTTVELKRAQREVSSW